MDLSYKLNIDELDDNFIKSIKQLFKNKDKEITIYITDSDDLAYLSKIPGMIKSIKKGIEENSCDCLSIEDIGWK